MPRHLFFVALTIVPLAGCAASTEPASDGAEQVGASTSALCSDPGIAAATVNVPTPATMGFIGQTSPTAGYGSSACANRWVVDVTGTLNVPVEPIAEWADFTVVPTTESNCLNSATTISAYGLVNGTTTWELIGSETNFGTWAGGTCSVPNASAGTLSVSNQARYSAVRVAAESTYPGTPICGPVFCLPNPIKVKVWAGVYDHRVPE